MAHASAILHTTQTSTDFGAWRWSSTNILNRISRYFALKAAERDLHTPDDRLLTDIGIIRGAIHARVWAPSVD
ncbi:MAG: hypothetical protein AAGB04_13275 [Pseudomonadota bacterium]